MPSYLGLLINFELFYRKIDNLNILYEDNLDYIKAKIKDLVLMSFFNYNVNISNEEFET